MPRLPFRARQLAAGGRERPMVALVGFMGAGKTSVGRALARRLRWRFVDLDDVIVERERRSVAELFEASEAVFRRAESAALRAVLAQRVAGGLVLALGGGAFVQPRNAGLLARAGVPVVFLDAQPDELLARCRASGVERPLLRGQNQFRQLYGERRVRYMRADVRIDTGARSIAQVAARVHQWLRWRARDSSAAKEYS